MFITKSPKQQGEGVGTTQDKEVLTSLKKQNEELLLRLMNLERILMEKFNMSMKELSSRYNLVKLDVIINNFEKEEKELEIKLDPIVVTNERNS